MPARGENLEHKTREMYSELHGPSWEARTREQTATAKPAATGATPTWRT